MSISQDSQLVSGVAFKKTFSYAGFEMQPKRYENPKIALLNVELELKAEKDNAEVRVKSVEVRHTWHIKLLMQSFVLRHSIKLFFPLSAGLSGHCRRRVEHPL